LSVGKNVFQAAKISNLFIESSDLEKQMTINESAFAMCPLKSITVNCAVIPSVAQNAFSNGPELNVSIIKGARSASIDDSRITGLFTNAGMMNCVVVES
jgi:hypothetical protein